MKKQGKETRVDLNVKCCGVVAERMKVEKLLEDSHKFCLDVVERLSIPCFVINKDHEVTHWNAALESLSGVSKDKIIGTDNQWRAFYPVGRPILVDLIVDGSSEAEISEFYQGKCSKSMLISGAYEAEDFFPDLGERGKWLHFTASPIIEENGKVMAAVETLQDITERKCMGEGVREATRQYKRLNEKYETLIKNIPVTIYSCLPDETATMIYISDRWKDWSGYSHEECDNDPWTWPRSVHPEDLARATEAFIDACQKQKEYVYEYRMVHKDTGKITYVRDYGVPIKDEEGNLIRFDGIIMNVTGRKIAEEALRESEEFSYSLLSNSPNPIVVINPDTSVRYANPALEALTGFAISELADMKAPYPWLTEETQREHSRFLKKATQEEVGRIEGLFQKKDGERFWVEITSRPVMSDGKLKYYVEIWNDITEQKELRDNLQLYTAEITKAQEEERRRIALELHDVTLQALFGVLADIEEIIRDESKSSGRNVQRLDQLQGKIDSIMGDLRRVCYSLRPAMLDDLGLVPSLKAMIEDLNLEGEVDCHFEVVGCPWRLPAEKGLALFRICQEALQNIRKHAGAMEVTVRLEFSHSEVRMRITDNGRGFVLPRFLSTMPSKGGLGLVGMRERARLVNGNLSIESEVNKGTTVEVRIPVDVKIRRQSITI